MPQNPKFYTLANFMVVSVSTFAYKNFVHMLKLTCTMIHN